MTHTVKNIAILPGSGVGVYAIYQGRGQERQGTILFVQLTPDITLLTAF